jgi:peptidyl-prolyl cis-trans isomerase SurA
LKKIIFIGLLLICAFYLAAGYAKSAEQELDQVIAIVNDDIITKSELSHALKTARMQMGQNQPLSSTEKGLKKQILDQVINRKLQLQVAQQIGIKVTDEDLNKTIEKVAEQNNLSLQNLYEQIGHEGMTREQYRSEMRDQITLRKLQQQEVVSRLSITPQEVKNFIQSKAWQNNNESKEYQLDDMLIPLSDTPSPEEMSTAKKRAQVLTEKLNQGKDFNTVVKAEENSAPALQSTHLEWRKLADIPTAFAEPVSHMQAQEIAGPIQTSNGLHIIRVAGIRSQTSQQTAPDQKQAEEMLLERKFEEAVQNWMSRLRHQAYIVNTINS